MPCGRGAANEKTETVVDDDFLGTTRELTTYFLYPGAHRIMIKADMLDGSLTENGLPIGQHWKNCQNTLA